MPATLVEHNLASCISKVTNIAGKVKNVLYNKKCHQKLNHF